MLRIHPTITQEQIIRADRPYPNRSAYTLLKSHRGTRDNAFLPRKDQLSVVRYRSEELPTAAEATSWSFSTRLPSMSTFAAPLISSVFANIAPIPV